MLAATPAVMGLKRPAGTPRNPPRIGLPSRVKWTWANSASRPFSRCRTPRCASTCIFTARWPTGRKKLFAGLFEAKKQRFRDQVIATIRSADMADFTEAGLGLIKRRILETTNRTIGKPCLEAVLFSDFSFIEQ